MKPSHPIRKRQGARTERGYLMVGLLATLTLSLLVISAAAPQVAFESQREKEAEMLWRGQQIALALQRYSAARGNQPPTSLEELVQGVNTGVKKVHFLRPHALCDPMEPCEAEKSNWRLVHAGDPVIASMIQSMQAYMQKRSDDPQLQAILGRQIAALMQFAPRTANQGLLGQPLGASVGINAPPGLPPGAPIGPIDPNNPGGSSGVSFADSAFGRPEGTKLPIIGVVSRNQSAPIRTILDIEKYDKGLFFIGGTVMAGGFFTPFSSGEQAAVPAVNPCPGGGFLLPGTDGKLRCFGGLNPGPQQRTPGK